MKRQPLGGNLGLADIGADFPHLFYCKLKMNSSLRHSGFVHQPGCLDQALLRQASGRKATGRKLSGEQAGASIADGISRVGEGLAVAEGEG